jgi:1-phosphofructokinase family hexose kinase
LILTLTLNPAIDRNVTVDKLVFEDRAYILSTREAAGGRGINASCVIHSYGGDTLAIAPCGGKNGKRLEEFLLHCGFPVELVRVKNDVRVNMTIADRQGLAVKLNEMGPSLSAAELARIERAVKDRLPASQWLMLCGSAPPGVPRDFYARLVRLAKEQNVQALVDTDGEWLDGALEAKPAIVAPNQQEAERLLGRVLLTRTHFLEAAGRIRAMGAEGVVLSLGSRGAIGAAPDGTLYEATPPRVDALCPIGAGDALAAAFVWSIEKKNDFAEALRWGVAAGTASARLPGVSFASPEQTKEIYQKVEVKRAKN